MKRSSRLAGALGVSLVAWAVVQELRKPRDERQWHGRVLKLVPYDLRPPTPARLRQAWWNPSDPRLLTDKPLGFGWTVNLARLFRRTGRT